MKLSKENAEIIRTAANEPDGAIYYHEIIEQLKGSSKTSVLSLIVAIASLVVAMLAFIFSLL